jgi:hypothetical protein
MKCRLAVLLFLASSATAKTTQTNVCAVVRAPAAYDGRTVRLRATVSAGFEIFAIHDPKDANCGTIWLTYAGGGPIASTSMGALTPNVTRPEMTLHEDAAMKRFRELLGAQMHPRDRGTVCMPCNRYSVTATMTRRIDYAGKGLGFGHLNMFPARFVLESVSGVSAKDGASEYDAKKFSTAPVRFPTAYLSGRVLAPDGAPVRDADVNITSTRDVPMYMRDFAERTDATGVFTSEVPPGTYRVCLNLNEPPSPEVPYAAKCLPRTLTVADRQRVDGITIHISEKLHPRTISLAVIWPDGKPVEDANVWLTEVRNPFAVVGTSVSHTNTEGLFDLIGFDGIDYVVHADIYSKPLYTPHCAEKRTIKSGDGMKERIVMVLGTTGEVCRQDD